jgi:threonine synthase
MLGWIAADIPPPRLVVVQASGCAPVVRAWEAGETQTTFWEGAETVASGLRVPGPLAGGLILRALRETNGTALAVADEVLRRAAGELARAGLWLCPEGAALLPAVRQLRATGWIRGGERVVLLNTGTGLLYPSLTPAGTAAARLDGDH